jgi:hypothetical protein
MSKVIRPIPIDFYYFKARNFVKSIKTKINLTSVILDDWNTGENKKGPRLIYGGKDVEHCPALTTGTCRNCPLFNLVGEDDPHDSVIRLRTSLCKTTDKQLELFLSKQPCLNCKTIEQYMEAFIIFTATLYDPEELDAEFEWIKGFRVVTYNDKIVSGLKEIERKMKEQIAREVVLRLKHKPTSELAERLADKYALI